MLSYVDVPLCSLEKAAVQVGEQEARAPDVLALEELLVGRVWGCCPAQREQAPSPQGRVSVNST